MEMKDGLVREKLKSYRSTSVIGFCIDFSQLVFYSIVLSAQFDQLAKVKTVHAPLYYTIMVNLWLLGLNLPCTIAWACCVRTNE